MPKDLDEILKELEQAEKEYQQKCALYGIEETNKKRKSKNDEESAD